MLLPTEETSQPAINGQTIPHFFYKKTGQNQTLYSAHHDIFQDTLANNIRFYTPEAQMRRFASDSVIGLDELVKDLPEGIRTLIGESGRMLREDKRNE